LCGRLIDKIWAAGAAGGMMMVPGFTGARQATPAWDK